MQNWEQYPMQPHYVRTYILCLYSFSCITTAGLTGSKLAGLHMAPKSLRGVHVGGNPPPPPTTTNDDNV